jgi:hypothetical protein
MIDNARRAMTGDPSVILCGHADGNGACDEVIGVAMPDGTLAIRGHLIPKGPGIYGFSRWNAERVARGQRARSRRPRFHPPARRYPGLRGTADMLSRGRIQDRVIERWDFRAAEAPCGLPCDVGHPNRIDPGILGG